MARKAIYILLVIVISHLSIAVVYAQEPATENSRRAEDTIPFKRQADQNAYSSSRVVLVTMFAIGVALGGIFFLRKYLQQKGLMNAVKAGRIVLTDVKRVSPKLTVYLISVDAKDYLIAQAGDQTTIIRHDAAAIE